MITMLTRPLQFFKMKLQPLNVILIIFMMITYQYSNIEIFVKGEKILTHQYVDNKHSTSINPRISSVALKLLRHLYSNSTAKNVIFSPINLFTAFGLCHLGASEAARKEVARFLNLPDDGTEAHSLHENISATLKAVKNVEKGKFNSVNGMFVRKLIPLKQTFSENVRKYYGSDVVHVDFESNANAATNYINKWIADETKNRIPRLFKEPLSTLTKVVFVNTVYYSANWAHPFKDYMTHTDKFNTGHEIVDVATMHNKKEMRYINYGPGSFEAIALPYDGEEFFMYILLPYGNRTIKQLADSLTTNDLQTMIDKMGNSFAFVDYKIPKIKLTQFTSLSDHLKAMGVRKIFENSNFDNMTTSADLHISEITHAVEIENDEKGTVAAAVDTLEYEVYAEFVPPSEPITFYVDKPFLFFISHAKTSIPLYYGLIHNPTA